MKLTSSQRFWLRSAAEDQRLTVRGGSSATRGRLRSLGLIDADAALTCSGASWCLAHMPKLTEDARELLSARVDGDGDLLPVWSGLCSGARAALKAAGRSRFLKVCLESPHRGHLVAADLIDYAGNIHPRAATLIDRWARPPAIKGLDREHETPAMLRQQARILFRAAGLN